MFPSLFLYTLTEDLSLVQARKSVLILTPSIKRTKGPAALNQAEQKATLTRLALIHLIRSIFYSTQRQKQQHVLLREEEVGETTATI